MHVEQLLELEVDYILNSVKIAKIHGKNRTLDFPDKKQRCQQPKRESQFHSLNAV
jgi:hypothetical protein